jgi:hypothetical protein
MKRLFAIVVLALLACRLPAALPQPDLLAQIHFAGAQRIAADPGSTAFTNEFCSPAALALRAQTAGKLSVWLAGWLQTNLNVTVADGSAKLRPLFDDLQKSEWFLESRAAANSKPVLAIAIHLDPARAQLWQNALKPFFSAATFSYSGFSSSGGWFLFDSNPSLLKLSDHLVAAVAKPSSGWFDADINWPRLAGWYPTLKDLAIPETQLGLTASAGNFYVKGKCFFPSDLALNLDTWRVPTNLVRMPFDGFTAVRGFAPWLASQSWAQPYHLSPTPNQFFSWALPSYPFQDYAAIPVPNAAAALAQAYSRVTPEFADANNRNAFMTTVTPTLNSNEIDFVGMPFIGPQLKAVHSADGDFLFLDTFPSAGRPKPLPPELYQRLATKNLVFYHWEITAVRMTQLLQLSQFSLMITLHRQLAADSAAFHWLERIGPDLGNTDTEITQSGPAEFTVARKAPGILTATELYVLANWLEATNFPGCDIKLPPRLHRRTTQPFHFTTPATAPGH